MIRGNFDLFKYMERINKFEFKTIYRPLIYFLNCYNLQVA